jgi:hypothetical protein
MLNIRQWRSHVSTDSTIGYHCKFDGNDCGVQPNSAQIVTRAEQREYHASLFGYPKYQDTLGISETAIYSQGVVCLAWSEAARTQFPAWIAKALLGQRIWLPPPAIPLPGDLAMSEQPIKRTGN